MFSKNIKALLKKNLWFVKSKLLPDLDHIDFEDYRFPISYEEVEQFSKEELFMLKNVNEFHVRRSAEKGLSIVKGMPLKVVYDLTINCNLNCKMCECAIRKKRAIEEGKTLTVPYETFERVSKQFFPYARIVNLTLAGEPLMVPYLDRVIELVERWQVKLEIFTNGQLWNEEKISRIAPSVASIITSFDGGTPETFNRIRLGADFNTVTKNIFLIEKWRKENSEFGKVPALSLNVTLMKENISELPTILRIAKVC